MANALHLTAPDLLRFGLIDQIVPEPPGGAHKNPIEAARLLKQALIAALRVVSALPPDERQRTREQRIRRYGTISG